MKVCDVRETENFDMWKLLMSDEHCQDFLLSKYSIKKYQELADIVNSENISDADAMKYVNDYLKTGKGVDYVVALVYSNGVSENVLHQILDSQITERIKEAFVFRKDMSSDLAEKFIAKVTPNFACDIILIKSNDFKKPNDTIIQNLSKLALKIAAEGKMKTGSEYKIITYLQAMPLQHCKDIKIFEKMIDIDNAPPAIYVQAFYNPLAKQMPALLDEIFDNANCTPKLMSQIPNYTPHIEGVILKTISESIRFGTYNTISPPEQFTIMGTLKRAIRNSSNEEAAMELAKMACEPGEKLRAETEMYNFLAKQTKFQSVVDYLVKNAKDKEIIQNALTNHYVEHDDHHCQVARDMLDLEVSCSTPSPNTEALIYQYGLSTSAIETFFKRDVQDARIVTAIIFSEKHNFKEIKPYIPDIEQYKNGLYFRENLERAGCLSLRNEILYNEPSEMSQLAERKNEVKKLKKILDKLDTTHSFTRVRWVQRLIEQTDKLARADNDKIAEKLAEALELTANTTSEIDFYLSLEYGRSKIDDVKEEYPNYNIENAGMDVYEYRKREWEIKEDDERE